MRPIPTSGSCSTLVEVVESREDSKLLRTAPPTSLQCVGLPSTEKYTSVEQEKEQFVETNLYLPAREDLAFDYYDDGDDETYGGFGTPWTERPASDTSSLSYSSESKQTLKLPSTTDGVPVDKYLRSIPSLIERAEELQAQPAILLSDKATPNQKVLNICQGEIGHATSKQADIIVSDKATTCHIVAVRSTSSGDAGSEPLVSLCHVDKPQYEDCLRDMVETHKEHHGELSLDAINMDLHIVGGYSDPDGSSLAITEHLIKLFGQISIEEKNDINMNLKTCVVSSLNDDGFCAPIGRGVALDTASGDVFLAAVDKSVAGPARALRAARLWSNAPRTKLAIAHTQFCDDLIVGPFEFSPFKTLSTLLRLPDGILLQYTSTSPDVEDDEFCSRVRSTLRFIRDNSPEDFFGPNCNQPVLY